MTAIYLIGALVTAVLYPVLFASRYPGQPRWIIIGVVVGLVAMLLWPVTLWVAVAMWLTGFTRPNSTERRRRRVVLPLAALGSFVTLLGIGMIVGPTPVAASPTPLADIIPTTTAAAPATTTAPTTTPPPTATPTATATATTTAPTTTTRAPAAATPAPQPRPAPRPAPKPQPDPDPEPNTERRTGNTGHPCLPGERDGDNDGYCGEGR